MPALSLPSSAGCAAQFRGPPCATVAAPGKFVYTNSLDREYDDSHAAVRNVTFNISRYGEHEHSITFDPPVTEKEAIIQVEAYLSEPLAEGYYAVIQDDMFHGFTWDEAKEEFACRGDALTDARFLERTPITDGAMRIETGS